MTPLPILIAAVFLGTGNCSFRNVHGSFFPPIAASMFVKFKSVIEIFWDEDFMVRNTVKKGQSWCSAVICRRRSYRRAYLFQAPLRGGLIETSGLFEKGAGVFNLEKTMASVLHKDLQYNVDKLKYKKIGGHAAEDQKQIRTFSW